MEPGVVDVERVVEVGVGGSDDAVGVGGRVVHGVDGVAAEPVGAVAANAEDVAGVALRTEVDLAVAADGQGRDGGVKLGVLARDVLLEGDGNRVRRQEQRQEDDEFFHGPASWQQKGRGTTYSIWKHNSRRLFVGCALAHRFRFAFVMAPDLCHGRVLGAWVVSVLSDCEEYPRQAEYGLSVALNLLHI